MCRFLRHSENRIGTSEGPHEPSFDHVNFQHSRAVKVGDFETESSRMKGSAFTINNYNKRSSLNGKIQSHGEEFPVGFFDGIQPVSSFAGSFRSESALSGNMTGKGDSRGSSENRKRFATNSAPVVLK